MDLALMAAGEGERLGGVSRHEDAVPELREEFLRQRTEQVIVLRQKDRFGPGNGRHQLRRFGG
jgi:hypothetical protein